jgi:6-pyruvoyltetrahydropterin/6-carboxytetrahydropterin synthase
MFEIDITRDFSAAHRLSGYQGNCSNLHGHNWTVMAVVQANELDEIGIALDFKKLKKTLDAILDEFDHANLSDLPYFKHQNPTSEILAKTIFEKLAEQMDDDIIKVARVRVCESPGSGATYIKG